MSDLPSFITFLQTLPVISILSGVLLIFFIIFSFSITYHWIVYSRNPIRMVIVLILYYGVSLFLIGSIVSSLSYV
ncbi:MAG: hypothetical protein ACJKSS_01805 [Patescibacteria group bacterium UBA2103]